VALTAIIAAPASAQERRRPRENTDQPRQAERAPEQAASRERAVTRTVEPRREQQARQADQNSRVEQNRRVEETRRAEQARQSANNRRSDNNRSNNGRYDNRSFGNGRYYNGRYYAPRIIRPTIIRVAPYRPYVYRPSYRIGVYYGTGGYYPYGVTPRGYYEPIPGRYYGGVRITGVPRDAEVFADGYYVGLVNDFDGIFQHVNLEAGAHHLEIDWGGAEPIGFDVFVRPGETTTFRGDGYFHQ
jgi:hypothetical protein